MCRFALAALLPVMAFGQSAPVRVGSNEQHPLVYRNSTGAAEGFFVSAFREAGRRLGRDIQWVLTTDSPVQAAASGQIDIWAGAVPTAERRNVLHFTEPWWSDPYQLLVRADSPFRDPASLSGRKLTIHRGPPLTQSAEALFRGVHIDYQPSSEDVLRTVCTGAADAALLTNLLLRPLLLRRPASCEGIGFRDLPQPLGGMQLAIAAPFSNARLADDFRAELRRMQQDGALFRIAVLFPGVEASIPTPYAPPPPSWLPALVVLLLLTVVGSLWLLAAERRRKRLALASAEGAARAKEEFLATVSHEIRTPMNAVLGYLDLLEDTPLNSEQKHLAGDISRATTSLLTLLSDILDFSRIHSGNLTLAEDRFDLVSLLRDVASSTVLLAEAKDLELAIYIDPQSPRYLRGDAGRIRQILLNLSANAVKFTTAGCVKLDAGYRGGALLLVVRDTGAGIPATQLDAIFEPFAQVDSTDTRRYGGLGLGLAIVRDLVRLMRGTIEVDSHLGIGSQFTVRLPMQAESAESWLPPSPVSSNLCAVLLLRESANTSILREYLRAAGAEVHEFRDEEDATGWLRSNGPTATKSLLVFADPRLLVVPELFAHDVRTMGWNNGKRLFLAGPIPVLRFLTHRAREPFHGSIEWPVSVDALLQVLSPAEPLQSVATPQPALSGRVLVVDDNPINRKVASALLRKLGCEVDVADDGHAAADMCARTRYSVVLMDCQMPLMDGYAAANMIRSRETPSFRTRIIGVSASTEPETRTRCLEAGMDGYLPKPLTALTLRRLIEEIQEPDST